MMNKEIRHFLLKGVGIYVVWFVLYELWLLPQGHVDEWLSLNILSMSGGLLQVFGHEVHIFGRVISIGASRGIELVNGCNGLEAIGLFLGFVLAFPGQLTKRLIFLTIGILVIYIINIFRIVVLAVTQVYYPDLFDITHDYSTTTIFYVAIMALWMIWANYGGDISALRGNQPAAEPAS